MHIYIYIYIYIYVCMYVYIQACEHKISQKRSAGGMLSIDVGVHIHLQDTRLHACKRNLHMHVLMTKECYELFEAYIHTPKNIICRKSATTCTRSLKQQYMMYSKKAVSRTCCWRRRCVCVCMRKYMYVYICKNLLLEKRGRERVCVYVHT
jgi:hypothetical protein